jgi:hypothetical protein
MNSQARVVVGALSVSVIVLLVAFAFIMADGMDGDHHDDGDAYGGMMGAMGDMDSDDMRAHMQEMMDDGTFARMQEHMANHESMPMTGNMDIDQMMHQMMDGMMDHMMSDPDRHGSHHPSATTSPQ